jgi:hypothetical protein
VLGTIAAAPLGAAGARAVLGEARSIEDAAAHLDGYRPAMAVGAVIAPIGAGVSLGRGPAAQGRVRALSPPPHGPLTPSP